MTLENFRRQSKRLGHRSIGNHVAKVFIQHIDPTARNTAGNRSIERLTGAQGFFSAIAFDTEGKLAGNGQAEIKFAVIKHMGRVEIRHELTDELPTGDKRNEGKRADAFPLNNSSKRVT